MVMLVLYDSVWGFVQEPRWGLSVEVSVRSYLAAQNVAVTHSPPEHRSVSSHSPQPHTALTAHIPGRSEDALGPCPLDPAMRTRHCAPASPQAKLYL